MVKGEARRDLEKLIDENLPLRGLCVLLLWHYVEYLYTIRPHAPCVDH